MKLRARVRAFSSATLIKLGIRIGLGYSPEWVQIACAAKPGTSASHAELDDAIERALAKACDCDGCTRARAYAVTPPVNTVAPSEVN